MASYKTHNAVAKPFKHYPCEMTEAKRIEKAVIAHFEVKPSGEGREWFAVTPEAMEAVVVRLLGISTTEAVVPALHGVALTETAYALLEEIKLALGGTNPETREKAYEKQKEVAEIFAKSFDLGIPEHGLPELLVRKDKLAPDWTQLEPPYSQQLYEMVRNNHLAMPNDDHVRRFFRLARLASGHHVAFCTAKVSMPYLPRIASPEEIKKMSVTAASLGWFCTIHNDWSWHYPGETGLVLYQAKMPIEARMRQFNSSFRKWVIERQKILKMETFDDPDLLQKAIDDITHDVTFPLEVATYDELAQQYLEPFFCIPGEDFFAKSAHQFLFDKWYASTQQP